MSILTVYKASAGSGKTFTLAAEYIARLLQGEPGMYRHILAVTFTNKATAEMKERILQRLWDLSMLPDNIRKEDDDFLNKIMDLLPDVSIADIRKRAADALHALTHDYDRFHVETIDSFFQSLLSNLAHELGLAAGFKVDLDDKEAISKGVERLMAELPERKQVMEWVLNYIQERIGDNKRWDITAEVNSLARELMKEHFMRHDEELQKLLDDNKVLGAYRGKLKNMKSEAADGLSQAAQVLNEAIEGHGNGYGDFSNGNRSLRPFVQRMGKGDFKEPSDALMKWLDSTDKWLKKADLKNASLVEHADKMRELLNSVVQLREHAMPIINSCDLSLRHINPLRLLNEISREVNTINNENNRFMLAKTPQLFDKLVEGDDASFVFEKAGTTYRHVMIDEFQDTSTLQWKNFKKLLVENMASGNGCLLVGDVKQSIYRFRGGDWSILNHIDTEFANGKPAIHNLDQNFRSAENIIEFNNLFFPLAAQVLDEHGNTGTLIQDIYSDVRQNINHKPGGCVRIRLYDEKKGETEETETEELSMEDDLALQIRNLHDEQGIPYNKIAILVRYNRSTGSILTHFAQHYPDIPLVSDEAFLLSASPAVQLVVHALRCLNDANDTIAAAYVSHCYHDEILGEQLRWTDIVEKKEELLPEAFRAEQREELKEMPLYELCELLIKIFRLNEGEGAAPYLFAFLDQVLSFLEDSPSDIAKFLNYWDESLCNKPVPAGEVEGVRILTIHKSKGLAFHTVLLPYCDWSIEKDHLDSLLWCEPKTAPYNEIPLIPVPLASGKTVQQSIYADDYEQEHQQRRIENLNLLYVAFTRAQQNLYIWAQAKEAFPADPTIGDLIRQGLLHCENKGLHKTEGEDEWRFAVTKPAAAPRAPRKEGKEVKVNPLEIHPESEFVELKSFDTKVEFMQSNKAKDFLSDTEDAAEEQQESYISQGKLLHRLFANIRTREDIPRALLEFEQEGLIATGKPAERLHKLIEKRMADPLVATWFDGSWQLFNECTILSRDENGILHPQRPDRVMVKGKEAVVIDFKFGKPQQRYRDQVTHYADLLKRMGYGPIKAFLWYVYTGEVDKCSD